MFEHDNIWETLTAILFAVMGGLARLLSRKDKRKLKWGRIFSEIFISAFAGLMVLLVSGALGLSGSWIGALCGMAGWMGARVLDLLEKPVSKKLGIDSEDKPVDKD